MLKGKELIELIDSVFSPGQEDKQCAILVDIPDSENQDNQTWKERRRIAGEWALELNQNLSSLPVESVNLIAFPNVHSNNADLPEIAYVIKDSPENLLSHQLIKYGKPLAFEKILSENRIILAPTEFSTTAPLKLMAKKFSFRAATMPGFSQEMIPALRLDYGEINRRVIAIKELLDPAVAMDIQMTVKNGESCSIHFDLRFRTAHASGGRFPDPGTAGNLPSGECYIVPYEGEKQEPSLSKGVLPVQFEEEVVLYNIFRNRANDILSKGPYSEKEKKKITSEPAYSNIAELGFGVLKDFGIRPMGAILLDEKLGLHIAFGRSDHFGGAVGVKDFSSPKNVIHIDRIYIPETQSKIHVDSVTLHLENGIIKTLMKDGAYTLF
jgi:hypothetical protein